jgi:hypothetical protein
MRTRVGTVTGYKPPFPAVPLRSSLCNSKMATKATQFKARAAIRRYDTGIETHTGHVLCTTLCVRVLAESQRTRTVWRDLPRT